jgi:hypothetical protein
MPRIQMTPTVRFVLVFLRVYLLVLLALITVKFVRTFSGSSPQPHAPPPVQRVQRAESASRTAGLCPSHSLGIELRTDSSRSRVPWRPHHEPT